MGGWVITPQKTEHSLKGSKNIVKLAKVPPPFKNLMVRPVPTMLLKLAYYAPRNSILRKKIAQIMLDSQNNATLVSEMLC